MVETIYFKAPKQNPHLEVFEDDYLTTTNEHPNRLLENEQGTHYLFGSTRVTQEQADELVSRNPSVTIMNSWPSGWITKGEE